MADSAFELMQEILGPYNLPPDLVAGAWEQYIGGGGQVKTLPEILQWIRTQPAYKAAYPGIEELRADGSPYGSEIAYAQYVAQAKEYANAYGIPANLYDSPEDFVAMMKGGVSPDRLNQRYQAAASAVYTMPKEVREALTQVTGGAVSTGDLIGYFLDPDRAIPLLERKYQAAQVMGAGAIAGLNVDEERASRLGDLGVSYDQAKQGFAQVRQLAGLSAGLGQARTAQQDELTDAILAGDAQAQQNVTQVQNSRKARFGEAGGAAASQTGAVGLGASRTT